eukprot:Amastigsp_a508816_455.p2 type:complete len:109 gc:universal Amastigsp_a508816_455:1-327(+)
MGIQVLLEHRPRSMSDHHEEKPKIDQDEEHINVRIADQTKEELHFRIKKSTPMAKLMKAYATNAGVAENSFRFMFEGRRIAKTDTAESLGLEDDDVIDLRPEQTGGSL